MTSDSDSALINYYNADFVIRNKNQYRNPCVGKYYYKGRYRDLFQFQFTPTGRDYPPEYVIYNGHHHYVKEGYKISKGDNRHEA